MTQILNFLGVSPEAQDYAGVRAIADTKLA
jgi:hypothetical protein